MICEEYETPVGLYALNQIVNGKKLNYHLITLVKICKVLKCQPHSIVETEVLHERLKRLKNKIEKDGVVFDDSDGVPTMRDATDEEKLGYLDTKRHQKDFKDVIIEDKDNKWGGGNLEKDSKSLDKDVENTNFDF